MARKNFQWRSRPRKISSELEKRVGRVEPAIVALAHTHAMRGEAAMKSGASWTDRTGFARNALYGRAERTTIYLGTTNSEYGIYLELGTIHMAPRAIIQPTLQQVSQEYFSDAVKLVAVIIGGGRA